jgi:hypothetical protein
VVAIPFSYSLANASVSPYANAHGLDVLTSDGLHLISGVPFYTGIASTPFYNFLDINSVIGMNTINALTPAPAQTLTTALFSNLDLIAGEKLVIDFDYVATDALYNDFAFAMLQDSNGAITPAVLGTVDNDATTGATHFITTFTIGSTGTYTCCSAPATSATPTNPPR